MTTPAIRRFDVTTGAPGVIGLPCAACHATIIIINTRAYTGEPLYCQACQELIDHPDVPIPYRLVDLAFDQPEPAVIRSP